MTQTQRERIAAQLAVARNTGADPGQIARLQGELERLNKINEEAHPVVEAMEWREREQQQAEEHAATQRRNRQEREFEEKLRAHYDDRLNFYRQTNPGLPKEAFDRDPWPEMRRAYLAGEEDRVDQERRERAAPVW